MAIHTPLYRELYKYTNHCKEETLKKYVARFTFDEPTVDKTVGSSFLNYSNLQDINGNEINNSRVYFNTISSNRSPQMNKQIKVNSIPFSELPLKSKDILKALNKYIVSKISVTDDGKYECNDIESLGLRKKYWNNNYPDLKFIYNTYESYNRIENVSKYIYEIQLNSIELFEATGLLVTVFRTCKERAKNSSDKSYIYKAGKLSNFNRLYDGLNIRIRITSNNDLEIEFIDVSEPTNKNYELYDFSYEITISSCIKSIKQSSYTYKNEDNSICWDYGSSFIDNNFGIIDYHNNNGSVIENAEVIEYDNTVTVKNKYSTFYSLEDNIMELYFNKGIDKLSHLMINSYNYSRGSNYTYNWFRLIGPKDYVDSPNTRIAIDIGDVKRTDNELITCYYDEIIPKEFSYEMNELADIVTTEDYYYPTNDNVIEDEKNLIKSLPFSLQTLLEKETTLQIKKFDKILASSIKIYNGIPCVTFTYSNKHDSIMLFKEAKLMTPNFITRDKDDTYTIYIDISRIMNVTNSINDIIYGKDTKTKVIDVPYSEVYIVYDTDRLFIEDMKYNVKSIYKFFNKNTTTLYSVDERLNGEYMELYYKEDPDGIYVLYDGYYLEIENNNSWYLVDGRYTSIMPENYDGDEYIRVKTNQYLLPLNKDIDPNKIVISIEETTDFSNSDEVKYRRSVDGPYILLDEPRYYVYRNALNDIFNNQLFNSTNVFVKIDDEYFEFDNVCRVSNDSVYVTHNGETYIYNDSFYVRYEPGYVIPPYYHDNDIHYSKIGNKLVQLSNIFNIRKYDSIAAVDTYVSMKDDLDNDIIVEENMYDKQSLIHKMIDKRYGVDIYDNRRYYLDPDQNNYVEYDKNNGYKDNLFYKSSKNENGYESTVTIDSYKKEISQFIDMNKVYKFTLMNGEILDGGVADSDEYIQYLDFGEEPIDDYSAEYKVYDFNFTSPYTIEDSSIKAYRIDSSYSNFFINTEDDFLAYNIPNQLINSENRMLTFLNGYMTDEYVINKKLYSRLFGDNTIISFSNDPENHDSEMFTIDSKGEYYYNTETDSYIKDPNRSFSSYQLRSDTTYYKISDTTYIESAEYDANDIVDYTMYERYPDGSYSKYSGTGDSYYKLKNGYYILTNKFVKNDVIIVNYKKYFMLSSSLNGSYYISIEDYYNYTTPYSKSISSVYMCNMKNMILYQNHNGIKYDNGIFTVTNNSDSIVRNERQLYKDLYFLPLSTKYMLFFINGRFANPDIYLVSPTSFFIDINRELYGPEINQIQIYVYDKFLYNLDKYKDHYFTKEDVHYYDNTTHKELDTIDYTIYKYNDTLWKDHRDYFMQLYEYSLPNYRYVPKDTGYNPYTDLVSLYEIFGKYILNKYDIDSDTTLKDEILEYFGELFDKDGRMRLELIQDSGKRKYIY